MWSWWCRRLGGGALCAGAIFPTQQAEQEEQEQEQEQEQEVCGPLAIAL